MTIPTYAGVVTSTGVGTSTSPSLATIASGSAPTVGDLIFVQVDRASQSTTVDELFDGPSGYHRLGSVDVGGTFVSATFWKIWESGDSTAPTFSWGSVSDAFICTVHCIRGTDQTRPICRATRTDTSSTTMTWISETTPVADCLVLASAPIAGNRSGITPASGWTERVDTQQTGGSKITAYSMTQGFSTSGTSVTASVTIPTVTGVPFAVPRLFIFQPPQTATPKDVRVTAGTLTSPTATGVQNITGLGFDCKALIIFGAAVNSGSTSNMAWSQGIGADDGVTTAAQRCVGYNVFQNASGQGCKWTRNASIVCVLLPGNQSSPDLQASFSRITDGFSLNWTTVQASGYVFDYIAIGGADFRATVGAATLASSQVTTLPWRPSFVHAITAFGSADADSITNDVTQTDNSYGWLDCNTGAQFCLAINGPTRSSVRSTSFVTFVNTSDARFFKTTSTGFQWTGGAGSLYLYYLACNVVGGDTYFPLQVELQRADSSGTANVTQTFPNFAVGQPTTAKKIIVQNTGLATTNPSNGAHSGEMGFTTFQGFSAWDEDSIWYSYVSSTNQSRGRENVAAIAAPGKFAYSSGPSTIVWSTNDTVGRVIGLFTLGFIGQTYTVAAISDTVAVTDSAARGLVRVRSATDTVALTDSIAVVTNRGRVTTDSVAGTELFARTATYVRQLSGDSVAVSDSIARAVVFGRSVTYPLPRDVISIVGDTIARTATFSRLVTYPSIRDSIPVTDAIARTATFIRLATLFRDPAVTTDSIARTTTYDRRASDTVASTDSIATATVYARRLSDSVAMTDSVAVAGTRSRTTNDTVSVVDVVLAQQSAVRALIDAISVVDQVSPLLATSTSDSVAVADQLSAQLSSLIAPIVDVVAITDLLKVEVAIEAKDTVAVADSSRAAIAASRATSDVVALADVVASSASHSATVADALTLSDNLLAAFFATALRSANDSVSIVDDITAELVQGMALVTSSDVVAFTDAVSVSREFVRVLADASAVVDVLSVVLDGLRASTDTAATADHVTVVGAPYARTLVDSIAATDDVSSKASLSPTLADSISVVDQISPSATIRATDVVAVADLLAVAAAYVVAALSDVVALADTATAYADRSVATSDAIAALDSFALASAVARTVTDSVSTSDAIAMVLDAARTSSDTVAVADVVSTVSAIAIVVSDTAASVDALSVAAELVAVVDDVANVADALQADTPGASQLTMSDDADVADSLGRVASFVRSVADALSVVDDVQVSQADEAKAVDVVALDDAMRVELTFARAIPDVVLVTDVIAHVQDAARVLFDAISLADDLAQGSVKLIDEIDAADVVDAAALAFVYERQIVDADVVTDSVAREHNAARTRADSVAIVDLIQTSQGNEVTTADVVTISDALAPMASYSVTVDEAVTVTELVSVAVDKGAAIALSDSAATLDGLALEFAYARVTGDAVDTTDDLTIEQIGYEVEASDAITVADTVTKSFAVGKLLSDVVATPDVLSMLRTLGASEGGSSNDTVDTVDALFVERPKLATDQAFAIDSLGAMVWSARTVVDDVNAEDGAYPGEVVFIPYGVDANVGPIVMYAIENEGPLSISGGPDFSPGPGPTVFVTRLGDLVDVTDQMIQGASLAIEFTDFVEATG